jgi:hypothetical protein
MRLEVDPVSGERLTAVLQKAYGSTPAMLDRLAALTRAPQGAK